MFNIFTRKHIPLEAELQEVKKQIRSKITVPSTFTSSNLDVTFDIPKEFVRMTNENFIGNIKWREFHVSKDGKLISAQNNWSKHSNMGTHHHTNAIEHLYVINGLLKITTYNPDGSIAEMVMLTPRSNEYVIQAGVPHYAETLDKDTQFVVKFLEI